MNSHGRNFTLYFRKVCPKPNVEFNKQANDKYTKAYTHAIDKIEVPIYPIYSIRNGLERGYYSIVLIEDKIYWFWY